MNCMIALLGLIVPRVLIAVCWLADPARWNQTFSGGVVLPALGFLFLPWTTIMYVLFWSTTGLDVIGWLFVFIAFVGDIGTYGGGFLGNRERVSNYRQT